MTAFTEALQQQQGERGKCLLGLDVGKRSIGLAISDDGWKVASPLQILWRTKFTPDSTSLFTLCDVRQVGGLVVGWPLNMDGSQGPRCDSVRDFCHALMRLRDMPVLLQDERLSTIAVERAMLEQDMTRRQRSQHRDALAAAWILQSALDAIGSKAI